MNEKSTAAQILGITSYAHTNKDEIKAKFRTLALAFHPDKSEDPRAGDAFRCASEARKALDQMMDDRSSGRVGWQQPAARPPHVPHPAPAPAPSRPTAQYARSAGPSGPSAPSGSAAPRVPSKPSPSTGTKASAKSGSSKDPIDLDSSASSSGSANKPIDIDADKQAAKKRKVDGATEAAKAVSPCPEDTDEIFDPETGKCELGIHRAECETGTYGSEIIGCCVKVYWAGDEVCNHHPTAVLGWAEL